MKSRNIIILAVLVIALIAIQVWQKRSHEQVTSASDTEAVLDIDFAADRINRITLGSGADSLAVVLERLPENWVARSAWSHPVDDSRINGLITELDGLRGEYRSDDASVLADYGLGEDDAKTRVAVYGEEWDLLFDLDIGKRGERGGLFVKRPDDDRVFLTRANLLGQMGVYADDAVPESKHFLDLMVHKCEREEITAITLHRGETSLALNKVYGDPEPTVDENGVETPGQVDYSVWEWVTGGDDPQPLAKTKVDAIANAVSNVRARDIEDPKVNLDTYGLWRAERRVEIALRDGTLFEMRFGAEKRDEEQDRAVGHYMMTSQDKTIWLLDAFRSDQIFKSLEDLLPEVPDAEMTEVQHEEAS